MTKPIIQGAIYILLFFGAWFTLSQIDWLKVFKVEQMTDKTEQKLGELFWDIFRKTESENTNIHVINSVDTLVSHICQANNIDRSSIKVHILNKDEINAFALPNGYLIIYSGLILNSDSQDELSGVICHELAHIELNHVMKKLVKETGLSVLISMATNNGKPDIIKETAKMLSSSAFDRNIEKEADIKAIDYLINANVNPESFANFLYKLSDPKHEVARYFSWISTHPDSKERAEYIIEHSKSKSRNYKPILASSTWDSLKVELKN